MTPKVPDYGHREADKELMALIRRLHLSYRQARIGLYNKISDFFEEFEKQDAEKRSLYDSGELSHEDYMKWRMINIAQTKQWKNMLNQLSDDIQNLNRNFKVAKIVSQENHELRIIADQFVFSTSQIDSLFERVIQAMGDMIKEYHQMEIKRNNGTE